MSIASRTDFDRVAHERRLVVHRLEAHARRQRRAQRARDARDAVGDRDRVAAGLR